MLARVVDIAFTEEVEVVAATKALACPFNDDDVHLIVGHRPIHRRTYLSGHLFVDRVQAFGAVQPQAGHTWMVSVFFNNESLKPGHGALLIGSCVHSNAHSAA